MYQGNWNAERTFPEFEASKALSNELTPEPMQLPKHIKHQSEVLEYSQSLKRQTSTLSTLSGEEVKTRNAAKRQLMKQKRQQNELTRQLFHEMVDRLAIISVYQAYLSVAENALDNGKNSVEKIDKLADRVVEMVEERLVK
jgi:small-conductance mechanosensitive channel